MNKTMLPTIASHCPGGTSVYTVLQYAQEIKHSKTRLGDVWVIMKVYEESSCKDEFSEECGHITVLQQTPADQSLWAVSET